MVAQLWFGMFNIQPRLPSCRRQEVLRQLRGQSIHRVRTMLSPASLHPRRIASLSTPRASWAIRCRTEHDPSTCRLIRLKRRRHEGSQTA